MSANCASSTSSKCTGDVGFARSADRSRAGRTSPGRLRVLVTTASRHGATFGIAETIAAGLSARGIPAEARPVTEAISVDQYDAVVLGSAVYVGRWLKTARQFAERNLPALLATPVWLFSSGPLGPPQHMLPPAGPVDAPVMMRLTRARAHRIFGGRLDKRRLDLAELNAARVLHARADDYRDWDAIEAYAGEIAMALLRERSRVG